MLSIMKDDLHTLSHTVVLPPAGGTIHQAPAQRFIDRLLQPSLVLAEDWEALPPRPSSAGSSSARRSQSPRKLVEHGLLTRYQAGRIRPAARSAWCWATTASWSGSGPAAWPSSSRPSTSDLRHPSPSRCCRSTDERRPAARARFYAEMRTVARLRHPNIVAAIDAGRVDHPTRTGRSCATS